MSSCKDDHLNSIFFQTKPHTVECTEEICAPNCPHMEMIMIMIETVPNFLELLEKSDVALYTKVVNKMFL
ncbi:hypothetical protein ANCCAN_20179 [Ancylostoma caninum]|uniref:Uncharacterized protein n=1 Tax=Ancylostoma caninum TaxID=29170 RepID=A0A368FT62_ANCCA|nr:hypothetical protein ANCCAN_20179 [Ancylostoma caninum]